ncbi:MAG: YggS family pyridoxal phosphate-dependent enzyme [Desulfobacterales bacterium]|nr:YggS family pyridoxal phosphate-dependent enzyme [Desulfobacterales bacterium]MBF0395225.1 YggS family pyridoxal phosphate-dependent enzyme [Desulfobacterales bacterium]
MLKEQIDSIKAAIKAKALSCGRNPEEIKLIAVTKRVDVDRISEAIYSGITIIGESYIQEATPKIQALSGMKASWHFIGHLQSNKAKYAVKLFDLIHSVDSFKLAQSINNAAKKISKVQNILIQINIGMEDSKSGIYEEDAISLVKEVSVLPNISVKGLMAIPPYFDEPKDVIPYFIKLSDLFKKVKEIPNILMTELSMGMSHDFEIAIEYGATMVRVGTAIFGERA